MTQVVADLLEGQAIGNQTRRAGVTQRMRAAVGDLNAEAQQSVTNDAIDCTGRQWSPGRLQADEDLLVPCIGADSIDVSGERFSDRPDQRVCLQPSTLQAK
ncbi:hypothetical protein AB7M56_000139 [Bradyrhizobium elkanii]|uniref:hypothetical protein n=1 Tax=Bradyrhizobium sp. Mp64 TaxID=3042158 RepID=UPI00057091A1|nr:MULTISPECIES: hypothetical protein [Bradyrhizobium]MCP1975594.1 hypothetical protein [Bradyrhizobium elkanii]MCS3482359.1 hypothetical protein [Bradyrhizobium elkanii]MCS3525264.1 hypothetical protein [Bradyrhizobium elkanii]MCS4075833.1 hypothetical protein [Bradyrhizobium elkanii]MCS4084919.1 hypothetical protein [Bradyrhizobium elkanii]